MVAGAPGRVSTTTLTPRTKPETIESNMKRSSKKKPLGVGRGATPNCQSRGNFSDFVSMPYLWGGLFGKSLHLQRLVSEL